MSVLVDYLQTCAAHNPNVPPENITMLISPYAEISRNIVISPILNLFILCVESSTKRELLLPLKKKKREEDVRNPNIVGGSAERCIGYIIDLQNYCTEQSLPQPQLVFASNLRTSVVGMLHIASMLEDIVEGYNLTRPPIDVYFSQYIASTTPLSYHEKAEYRSSDSVYKEVVGKTVCSMLLRISDSRLTLAAPAPPPIKEEPAAIKEEPAPPPVKEEPAAVKEETAAVKEETAEAKPKRRRPSRVKKIAAEAAETAEPAETKTTEPAAEPEAGGDVPMPEMAQETEPTQPMAVDAM